MQEFPLQHSGLKILHCLWGGTGSIPSPESICHRYSRKRKKKKTYAGEWLDSEGPKEKKHRPGDLLWLCGLRIQHCQWSISGWCCGTGSIPVLGTSIFHRCGKKKDFISSFSIFIVFLLLPYYIPVRIPVWCWKRSVRGDILSL